jgi:transcriptional regulator with XRE-family HTH domain
VLAKRTASVVNAPASLPDRQVRFVAKGLRSLRTRLGLSAKQLSLLLGVSEQSVYNWETKKATPRKELLAAIIGLRDIGKRDAQQRLDAIKAPRRAKRGKRAK